MARLGWDSRFMGLAAHVAAWSKDPDCAVGAVLVSPDRRLIVPGYNGFPAGVSDRYEGLTRAEKLARTLHAELNAITNAPGPVRGWTLYCTKFPCMNPCALMIVQAGVARVVAPPWDADSSWASAHEAALALLREAGVAVTRWLPEAGG